MAMMDTSERPRERQLAVYAEMSGADKVMLAVEMAEQAKNIALDGIRSRNPDITEPAIHQAWLHMLHGDLATRLDRTGAPEVT